MRPCILPGNQFDHTFDNTQWTKAKINATISIMHFLRQAIWGDIWKRTVEKMSGEQVYYNHLRPAILEDTRANKTVPQLNWRTTNKKSGPGGPPDFSCWMYVDFQKVQRIAKWNCCKLSGWPHKFLGHQSQRNAKHLHWNAKKPITDWSQHFCFILNKKSPGWPSCTCPGDTLSLLISKLWPSEPSNSSDIRKLLHKVCICQHPLHCEF